MNTFGTSPINSAVTAGTDNFESVLQPKSSGSYGSDSSRYSKAYSSARGILIAKKYLDRVPLELDKGHYFQFNPQTINDVKNTLYEIRNYTGLSYNDYIWGGGGERIISFQLFLDNTPQSKYGAFRPDSYGSKKANEIDAAKSTAAEVKMSGDAFSNSRVHERGILPEVEMIQSFLHPDVLEGENTPLFAEGGVVTSTQFRPPAIAVLAIGPIYLEGVVKSAPVTYTLFDSDLTPIRATIDIEFAVFEFESLTRQIDWKAR